MAQPTFSEKDYLNLDASVVALRGVLQFCSNDGDPQIEANNLFHLLRPHVETIEEITERIGKANDARYKKDLDAFGNELPGASGPNTSLSPTGDDDNGKAAADESKTGDGEPAKSINFTEDDLDGLSKIWYGLSSLQHILGRAEEDYGSMAALVEPFVDLLSNFEDDLRERFGLPTARMDR